MDRIPGQGDVSSGCEGRKTGGYERSMSAVVVPCALDGRQRKGEGGVVVK